MYSKIQYKVYEEYNNKPPSRFLLDLTKYDVKV